MHFSTLRGYNFKDEKTLIVNREKEVSMFVVVVSVCVLLFLALAGADLLVANINSDELSNMGVERKP